MRRRFIRCRNTSHAAIRIIPELDEDLPGSRQRVILAHTVGLGPWSANLDPIDRSNTPMPHGRSATGMQFTVRVLGLREDGQWCAIALEMSLRGYGETFDEALKDLDATMEAQVSFAMQHGTLEEIWKPAEPQYVQLYDRVRRESMRDYLEASQSTTDDEYAASDLPIARPSGDRFSAVA